MKFVSIIKVEAANPNTGEVKVGYRAVTDTGKEIKIANTVEELKAAGTPTEILSQLVVVDGQYGMFAQLRKYKVLEMVTEW